MCLPAFINIGRYGRYQCFGCGFIDSGSSILGWIPIRIQSGARDQKWKKFTAEKKFAIYLSLGLRKGRPSYRRSLQPSKMNIQHFKTWNFLIFFYFCGSFFPPGSRYGSRSIWIRIQSGSETQVPYLLLSSTLTLTVSERPKWTRSWWIKYYLVAGAADVHLQAGCAAEPALSPALQRSPSQGHCRLLPVHKLPSHKTSPLTRCEGSG